jgi:hypothetical protein
MHFGLPSQAIVNNHQLSFSGKRTSRLAVATTALAATGAALLSGCADGPPKNPVCNSAATASANNTDMNIALSDNFTGRFIDGNLAEDTVNLNVKSSGLTSQVIAGAYNGNTVYLEDSGVLTEKIKGQFNCKPVDLALKPSGLSSIRVTGQFQDKPVDFKITDKVFGAEIKGSFNNKSVKLDVGLDFTGRTIEGTFEDVPVKWKVRHGLARDYVTGDVKLDPELRPDFLATLLLEAAAQSDDS